MSVVEIRGVTRDYVEGGVVVTRALQGVSLSVEKGEFMALAGPSGSGKTTLLNLIGGLDAPTSGVVAIDGKDLSSLSRGQLADLRRDHIGFVFQSYNLVPVLTAMENAEYVLELRGMPARDRRQRVEELFRRMGLEQLMNARPLKMSGGQQQRVAVARALAASPSVVLADEPTANLDQVTGHALVEMMRQLSHEEGVTFIFSTHDPMVLEHAERVVRLVDGKVVTDERKPGSATVGAS